eukprot:CAMPEP_0204440158 /NCGR_PEP_ID=MMETSP0470-20130426/82732_1 /ASSEMBLY_ACC=CAM_ASM_000385 /TAXON_ID=2969 /ORGANISM="Oxyrrhis marina" /LENGTH=38 /DNA_ID= /DNA_START= /DNA_END= /DNA_ORIENTATION=
MVRLSPGSTEDITGAVVGKRASWTPIPCTCSGSYRSST